MLNNKRIEQLEKLANAATAGPMDVELTIHRDERFSVKSQDDSGFSMDVHGANAKADALFYAEARIGILELIAELRRRENPLENYEPLINPSYWYSKTEVRG